MDDLVRSGRLLLRLGVVVAATTTTTLVGGSSSGCGGHEVGPVGISTPRAAERAPSQPTDAGSPVPADFRAHLSRISDWFLSEGHGEAFDAVVWANDGARAGADAGEGFADGAMLVEETLDRGSLDGGAPLGLLVMEKRAETWRFAAVGPDGEVASSAAVAACAQCHRDAPDDFVFRTPRPVQAGQNIKATTSAAMTVTAPTPVATAAATYDARSAGSAPAPSSR